MIRTDYFGTFSGTLKVFEAVLSFIGLLMVILFNNYSQYYSLVARTYTIISAIALGVTCFLIIINFLGFYQSLKAVLQYQKYFHLVWMMFVLSYSSIMLYNGGDHFQLIIAGISGILLAIAFLADGIHGFNSDSGPSPGPPVDVTE